MARINSAEVLNKIKNDLRLDSAREKVPVELAEKILPVFVANDDGVQKFIADDTINVNTKSWTVPNGFTWELQQLHVRIQATATVGSRRIQIEIISDDGTTTIWRARSSVVPTASQNRDVIAMNEVLVADVSGNRGMMPLPKVLTSNQTLKVFDVDDVDTLDDYIVHFWYKEISDHRVI